MRVVFVGNLNENSRSLQRLDALRSIAAKNGWLPVASVNTAAPTHQGAPKSIPARLGHKLRRPVDSSSSNSRLRQVIKDSRPDLVWIEKANEIRPETIAAIKSARNCQIVFMSEDDMDRRHNSSVFFDRTVELFDLVVTTKSANLSSAGPLSQAQRLVYHPQAYCKRRLMPLELDGQTLKRFGAQASFAGSFEKQRAASMVYLAQQGIEVRVWGNGWDRLRGRYRGLAIESRPVYGRDLAAVVAASRVNLCFLRKQNEDQHTSRTFELPALGGFMLAERTPEHMSFFSEETEVGLFGDDQELVDQTRRFLSDDLLRSTMAERALQRIRADGRDHDTFIIKMLREELGAKIV